MSVITASNFNVANLKIDATKKQLDNSPAAIVYLNYNGGKLRVQTPRLSLPYDAGDYKDPTTQIGDGKFKVSLDLKGYKTDPKISAYFNMLEAIDNAVLEQAVKSSANWLGKKGVTKDGASLLFTKSTRVSIDKKTNTEREPVHPIAIKKKYKTENFEATLYDNQNRKIEGKTPMDVLRRGCQVTCILDATSVWIAGGKFGVSWKLVQVRVDSEGPSSGPIEFLADGDDDEEAPSESLIQDDSAEVAVEEDEEEEEEEPVVQPLPTPVPVPTASAKKPVAKKGGK